MEPCKKDTASLILVVLRFERPYCVLVYVINVSFVFCWLAKQSVKQMLNNLYFIVLYKNANIVFGTELHRTDQANELQLVRAVSSICMSETRKRCAC